MAMDTSEVLDLSKENIQPLRQGRKASQLKTALQAQVDPETQQKLQRKREEYEYMIRMYEGDDPLEPYYNFVIWLEQSFPKIGRENNLIQLLEDTLIKFKECEKYKQDPRLVQLLVKYISVQSNPLELYQLVYDQGLGTMCSLLYKSWAEEYDKINDIKKADHVFKLGIGCRAQPLNELENAHVQFQLSIARRMIEGSLNPVSSEESSRTVLSKLKPSKVKTSRVSQTSAGVLPSRKVELKSSNFATPKFQVYREEESTRSFKSEGRRDEKFPKGSVADRENVMQAGKWCGQKQKQLYRMSTIPTTPSFQIHEDPEAACLSNTKSDFRPRALKVRREEFNPPVAVFEPPDPTKRPMYPKQLVYVGGRDVQLEEIRAGFYWKKLEKEEAQKQNDDMDICTNELREYEKTPEQKCVNVEQIAQQNSESFHFTAQNFRESEEEILFPRSQNTENDVRVTSQIAQLPEMTLPGNLPVVQNQNKSNSNPPAFHHSPSTSMTVNTRAAMNIIQQMWESPLSQNAEKLDISIPSQKSAFPVYTDQSDIPHGKSSFPVFCDDVEQKPSNPFQVYSDELSSASKKSLFSVYGDDFNTNKSTKTYDSRDPFAIYCDENAASTKKDPFEFCFKTPTSAPPKATRNPFSVSSEERDCCPFGDFATSKPNKDLFPVFCDENSTEDQSRSTNKSSKAQISSKNYFADDDEEELARPMSSLKMVTENRSSTNVINTPLPLIIPVNLQDTPLEPENKENQPPKDYSTPSERRPLSGILTPATNVPVQELQSDSDEDDDEFEGSRVCARQLNLDEETCTTRAFTIPLPASTPFSRSNEFHARKSSIYDGSYIADENVCPSTSSAKSTQKSYDLNHLMDNSRKLNLNTPNLSLILENSKELGGFSSSSSGNAGSKYITS